MLKQAIVLILSLIAVTNVGAQSTSAKRGAASIGSSLSDWAERQMSLDAEIELAKAKAEIEIDKQKRLQALQQQQSDGKPLLAPKQQLPSYVDKDKEEAKLTARHPQWVTILKSSVFGSWLSTRSLSYQQVCRSTQSGDVMNSCIDDFFGAKIVQAQ